MQIFFKNNFVLCDKDIEHENCKIECPNPFSEKGT